MQVQAKYMKANWSYSYRGRGHSKFTGEEKCSADGKEFNKISSSDVAKSLKKDNKSKVNTKDYSDLDTKSDNFKL